MKHFPYCQPDPGFLIGVSPFSLTHAPRLLATTVSYTATQTSGPPTSALRRCESIFQYLHPLEILAYWEAPARLHRGRGVVPTPRMLLNLVNENGYNTIFPYWKRSPQAHVLCNFVMRPVSGSITFLVHLSSHVLTSILFFFYILVPLCN